MFRLGELLSLTPSPVFLDIVSAFLSSGGSDSVGPRIGWEHFRFEQHLLFIWFRLSTLAMPTTLS
jgi:hypothetical protein